MPHSFHAGVDMVTVGRRLDDTNVATTSIDAESDLESRREALRLLQLL